MYLIRNVTAALRLTSKAVLNALGLLGKTAYVLFAIISPILLTVVHALILLFYPQRKFVSIVVLL